MSFGHFKAFSEPAATQSIPDPEALSTFARSRLNWEERNLQPHAGILALYRDLINLRRTEPACKEKLNASLQTDSLGENMLALKREADDKFSLLVVACLKGQGKITLGTQSITRPPKEKQWRLLWTTEDTPYTDTPSRPLITNENATIVLNFQGPCTLIFRAIAPK